jgi:hypothetical protein
MAWSTKELHTLIEGMRLGLPHKEVSRRVGKSMAACEVKWRRCRGEFEYADMAPQPIPPEAKAAPGHDIKEELRQFAAVVEPTKPSGPTITCQWDSSEAEDVGKLWEAAERLNARHIEKARTRHNFTVEFPGSDPIGIATASDQHIAPGTPVDMARMRADAEFIRDTPNLFANIAGDGVDNHIKHRAAVIAARTQPSDQYQLYEYYLSIMQEKILAVCSGNHDMWTNHFAGIDMVDILADRQRLCYAPDEARLDVELGGVTYKMDFRHQYRMSSSFNCTHCVKQWLRLGDREFDIGVIGHEHEPAMEIFAYRGKDHGAARPGSYQLTSAHSRQYGYNSTYPTCPTFILYPGERKITGFADMRDAGLFLRALLGK